MPSCNPFEYAPALREVIDATGDNAAGIAGLDPYAIQVSDDDANGTLTLTTGQTPTSPQARCDRLCSHARSTCRRRTSGCTNFCVELLEHLDAEG